MTERLQLAVIVRRANVLDLPCPAPRGPTIWIATAPEAVLTVRP
jgi:hypothetical protein